MLRIEAKVIRQSWTATYCDIRNKINKEFGEEILPHRNKLNKLSYEDGHLLIDVKEKDIKW